MSQELITYLGVDWGGKRIGLAIGDNQNNIATPYAVVSDLEEVLEVAVTENVDKIIIGEPRPLDGSSMSDKGEYNEFCNDLEKNSGIPVMKFDERLSSKAADSLSGKVKEKAPRDALAAMIILQSYLDSID